MTCDNIKALLPLIASSDLNQPESLQVQEHLANCPACAQELHGLQKTLQALTDASPTAMATVNLATIYQAEAQRAARSLRRWRWTAAGLAAAATLLIGTVTLTRLELRADGQQLVIHWGQPAAPPPETVGKPQQPETVPALPSTEALDARLARLEKLILLISEDTQSLQTQLAGQRRLDKQAAENIVQLANQLDNLRQETRRDRSALYAAMQPNTQSGKE